MPVSGLFSRWSASRRRALVLSSWGYLVGMGEVPLFFWLFPIYGVGTKPSTYHLRPAGRVKNQAEGCEEQVRESLGFVRGGSGSIGVKPAGVGQG